MRYFIVLLTGLIVGGLLVLYLFVGAPKAKPLPGSIVGAPDGSGDAPGTVVITLDGQFFNALLGTIFHDLGAPSYPLQLGAGEVAYPSQAQAGCSNQIALAAEGSGVHTGVQFTDGKILVPLAFNGSYNLLGNCVRFRGWAQTNIKLSFDQNQQTLYGQINVEGVHLEGVAPLVSGIVTMLVQRAINERINPLQVLNAPQLALSVPVQASGGTIQAQTKDVRAEVKNGALRLHITYDFSAG